MIQMSAAERDRRVIELRARGYTYAQIAKALGISKSGVRHALVRIASGREGRPVK